jgi:C-lobe and N-lobe beta barrels of Tf-binding protein B
MRIVALLLGTSLLSACGGAGPTTAGSVAPATGPTAHTFANPTETKTYAGIGVTQSYSYQVTTDNINNTSTGQQGQLYAGNATTVRDGSISITYNPRDAIFDINIADGKTAVSTTNRFQDPLHRTDFGGTREPPAGTPQLVASGIQYLGRSGQNTATATSTIVNIPLAPGLIQGVLAANEFNGVYDRTTFFYQKPGTSTQYVTFGGFLRNALTLTKTDVAAVAPTAGPPATAGTPATSTTLHNYSLSRGLFVYGENATNGSVPTSGTGTYSGAMVATMVFNDQADTLINSPTYFQMIEGSASTKFDFSANTFTVDLAGTSFAPQLDGLSGNIFSIKSGASFTANGAGKIDLVKTGGFFGQFTKAWFVNPDTSRYDVNIGGSSVDGAFYGPKAEEVGGSFRIVGGTPDERVDILGVFVGKK